MKRTGKTLEQISDEAVIKIATLKKVMNGSHELSGSSMRSIRLVEKGKLQEEVVPYGKPEKLRMIPVVSWAQAGQATAFDDLPADWMRRIPSSADDPNAFAVEIVGDSMEPQFKEGAMAILLPAHEPRTGDVVVANIKNRGAVMKVFHRLDEKKKIRLTSYNPEYPPAEYGAADFHWIYPVDSVTYKLKRK